MRLIYKLINDKLRHNAACQREHIRHIDNAAIYMRSGMLVEAIRCMERANEWEAKKL